MSGYSGTPLAKKLGIRAGSRVFVKNAPEHYARLVHPLPEEVCLVPRIDATTDLILVFALKRSELERSLRAALRGMRPDAAIWVSWPKRAARVATDLTEDVIRAVALPMKLVDVKVCAVDETWSGLKLLIRKAARPRIPAPSRTKK